MFQKFHPSNLRTYWQEASEVKKRAIKGAAWTVAGYGTSQVIRFASNLILTRLLLPELFGLMALAFVFLIGLNLFSDIGIGPNIIQSKRNDETFINTAWTIQVIRSFIIALFCWIIAWPVSQFYNEPKLLWLLPVLSVGVVLDGFKSTAEFTLNKDLALRKLIIFKTISQVISIVFIIVWAYFSPSIWALAGGNLIASFTTMTWSHFLDPRIKNRFCFDREVAKNIFRFGRWIFIATAMTFLANQLDRLMLAKLFSFEMLGIYTIAYSLSDIPRQVLENLNSSVFFPAIAKFISLPRQEFRIKLIKNHQLILVPVTIAVALLSSFGDLVIKFLYPDNFSQAAWMLPLLALGLWPNVLVNTTSPTLLALGKSGYYAVSSFAKALFMGIAIYVGFILMGELGAVIAVALNDIPDYTVISYGLWKEGLSHFSTDIKATAGLIVLIGLFLLLRLILGWGLPLDALI
ncbi:oligosaccharide flippase family protein [Trichothermofontia sichuanensis B231]|uniref:oligosaccharide flippase family protein n=1 Tax=Trichothermofontia sichuanensis TaxID=3045816 RepID=UPI002246D4F3|nr:oligosaccharide flippase family protein [Trichothermofontia sichuanensis]UZQ55930.1 oligosaccharide flippase family protein [Trichothermofontia sichuanensis B231]